MHEPPAEIAEQDTCGERSGRVAYAFGFASFQMRLPV
jgi:hypothetical protein